MRGSSCWGRETGRDPSITNPLHSKDKHSAEKAATAPTAEAQQTAAPPGRGEEPEIHPASPQHIGRFIIMHYILTNYSIIFLIQSMLLSRGSKYTILFLFNNHHLSPALSSSAQPSYFL